MKSNLMDTGAERAVLAGLMRHGIDAYVEVCDIINEKTFAHQNNQVIYKCMDRILKNQPTVDLASIIAAAHQLHLYEIINTDQELEYIRDLEFFPIKKGSVASFAVQLKKYEFARNLKSISNQIAKSVDNLTGDESIEQIMALAEDPLADFLRADSTSKKPVRLGEGLDEYLEYLESNPCQQIGIPTGLERFDKAIGGGLRRKCVDLISARPKVGKSMFVDNVALRVAEQGIPVLVLDTEMDKFDHIHRTMAHLSKVEINDIATGLYSEDDLNYMAVRNNTERLKSLPYDYINVSNETFESTLNIIKRWVIQEVGTDENGDTKDCVVIYDYLKLMSSSSITHNIQEYQALGFQITALHNLAVKYDFPCLTFAQLNRDGITKESTDAVSGSDRLIWLCTSFTIFKFKSDDEQAEDGPDAGNRKLVPIVCRHGAGMEGGNYINIQLDAEIATMRELHTRDEFIDIRESGGGIEGANELFEEED